MDDAPGARHFGVGEQIPVTLTLHTSNGEPRGRQTPIYSKYRPTVSFAGGPEVVCSVAIPRDVRSIAPGQTADATLGCQEAISVGPDSAGFVVIEGNKQVGVGEVRLPPAP
ncbi:hypothetical protein [Luteimonas suaedae]|uniref:hypothetical protein n=1 Tax=Luteimonas suaedae TaxID=2605430 RepID=UPI00165990A2|nr:hypothetical protein [Luteimonas suaedae]